MPEERYPYLLVMDEAGALNIIGALKTIEPLPEIGALCKAIPEDYPGYYTDEQINQLSDSVKEKLTAVLLRAGLTLNSDMWDLIEDEAGELLGGFRYQTYQIADLDSIMSSGEIVLLLDPFDIGSSPDANNLDDTDYTHGSLSTKQPV